VNNAKPENVRAAIILETRIDALGMDEVLDRAAAMSAGSIPCHIITANVDHVVGNHRRPALRAIFARAALTVPDGVPLLWAARLLKAPLAGRVNGTDLMERLSDLAARRGFAIFLLGGPEGSAATAARRLQERFPGLDVCGTCAPTLGFEARPLESEAVRALLRERRPQILFVSLGYPKGLRWIDENQAACGIPLAIEVGASFRYLAGEMRRAPRWMQRHGLEWLWRLGHEPRRLGKRYLLRDLPFFYYLLRQGWTRRPPGGE
jgi:N-acetylglucosaminyldiphosphoundecaprenol N-acetyl-beta-D-mannosaminyltransferase